jgi:hypothetical protein
MRFVLGFFLGFAAGLGITTYLSQQQHHHHLYEQYAATH